MSASLPYFNPNAGGPTPNKEKACTVVSHKIDGSTVEVTYQKNGAEVTSADLIYTLNGGARYEEWFRTPAQLTRTTP